MWKRQPPEIVGKLSDKRCWKFLELSRFQSNICPLQRNNGEVVVGCSWSMFVLFVKKINSLSCIPDFKAYYGFLDSPRQISRIPESLFLNMVKSNLWCPLVLKRTSTAVVKTLTLLRLKNFYVKTYLSGFCFEYFKLNGRTKSFPARTIVVPTFTPATPYEPPSSAGLEPGQELDG